MRFHITTLSVLLLPAFAAAQTSSHCLPIGTNGAYGCQSATAPTLTGGVVATADIDVDYDAATGMLTLVVDNTSPVVAGETNPVITRLGFNVPAGAVSAMTLASQTGTGGATPAFGLQFSATQSLLMGCFGEFSALLSIPNVQGGIGNPAATVYPHPVVAIGPVTFEIQLSGPGVGALTASDITSATSQNGSYDVAIGVKFQGGGVGGVESGFVSSGTSACCLNQAAVQPVGAGCAPTGLTIPTVTEIGMPVVGGPVGVDVDSPSTPNSVGLLTWGFSTTFDPVLNVPLPLGLGAYGFPGCTVYGSQIYVLGVMTDGNGYATYSFNIPSLQKWCDREITFQAWFLSGSGGLLGSAGLTQILGS